MAAAMVFCRNLSTSQFLHQILFQRPSLTCTPTTDGVSFTFHPTSPVGRAWAQIRMGTTIAPLSIVKSGAAVVGSASCTQHNVTIGNLSLSWQLRGCSLGLQLNYTLHVYVEDTHDLTDGSLWTKAFMVPRSVSNYFVRVPSVLGTPAQDGVNISFTAHAQAGRMWCFLLHDPTTVSTTLALKQAAFSLGARRCKLSEVPIDNTHQIVNLADCALSAGQTYIGVVYVEGSGYHVTDGVYELLPFTVPLSIAPDGNALERSYTDLGVASGAVHYYHVRATNYIGVGLPSPKSTNMLAASVPATPGMPSIAFRTLTSVTVAWGQPASLGAAIQSYRLFMNSETERSVFEEIYRGPDTTFTQASLTTGETYQFVVSAINQVGESSRSAILEASACVAPGLPGPLRVKSRSMQHITIQWEVPVSNGGCH